MRPHVPTEESKVQGSTLGMSPLKWSSSVEDGSER